MFRPLRLLAPALGLAVFAPFAAADRHVAVVSSASPEYTQRKFGEGKPQPESYVFMQGRYFEGIRADRSIEKMSFREIAGLLAPELARAQYFPTPDIKTADLLLIVHWGTTRPRVAPDDLTSRNASNTDKRDTPEMLNQPLVAMLDGTADQPPSQEEFLLSYNPAIDQTRLDNLDHLSDRVGGEFTVDDNARLLGYSADIRRLNRSLLQSTQEETLRFDLRNERYFIIVKAYDLRAKAEPGRTRGPVWSLYTNTSSPGNDFTGALSLMGGAAANFFGRATNGVVTVQPDVREGKVNLAPLIILGEVK